MIRPSDISAGAAAGAAVRWNPRSADLLALTEATRTFRARFIAAHLRAALGGFGRWSGLAALAAALRHRLQHRRTLTALTQLDDRLLRDIGVSRADIEATVTFCCEEQPKATTASVWQRLGAWLRQEHRRRHTARELSAMPDEVLADIGIERAAIPAIAAALAGGEAAATTSADPAAEAAGDAAVGSAAPLNAAVLAFVEVRRSVQRAANQNVNRPAA